MAAFIPPNARINHARIILFNFGIIRPTTSLLFARLDLRLRRSETIVEPRLVQNSPPRVFRDIGSPRRDYRNLRGNLKKQKRRKEIKENTGNHLDRRRSFIFHRRPSAVGRGSFFNAAGVERLILICRL